MGLGSISFDWNYIAGFGSPLYFPMQTLVNSGIGYLGGIVLSMGLYYSNTWRSKDFPFMSQLLFDSSSNSTSFAIYNTSDIITPDFMVDINAVEANGIPYLTGTYIAYLVTSNLGLTAGIVHMFLWNYDDIKLGWTWINLDFLKKAVTPSTYFFWRSTGERSAEEKEALINDSRLDPHFKLMLNYDEAPNSWYLCAFAAAWITGITCLYIMKSTLPWWAFIVSNIFLFIFMIFFGSLYAITGFAFNLQPFFQMIAGYMLPARPLGMLFHVSVLNFTFSNVTFVFFLANMYFNTYTWNGLTQGQYLLRDLKLAQQNKLSPKCTFVTQIVGCIFGALLNYVMMLTYVIASPFWLLSLYQQPHLTLEQDCPEPSRRPHVD